nr:hypothetical protein [uncultured Roseibium sp.]
MHTSFALTIGLLLTMSVSVPANADISGFTADERSNAALIEETISNTPELSELKIVNSELAIVFALRLHELQRLPSGDVRNKDRTLRENPEAILDLMKLIRLAAGGEKN